MGLDMWLYRKPKNDVGDSDEVCYWRKANQIRQWFVNNTKYETDWDCVHLTLSKDDLEKLLADCEKVNENHDLAETLLPTASKFFFGDTDYNERYFDIIEYTIKELKKILESTDFDKDEIYYYEWW